MKIYRRRMMKNYTVEICKIKRTYDTINHKRRDMGVDGVGYVNVVEGEKKVLTGTYS